MAGKIDPVTGLRKKTGGRVVGSVNKTTSARHEAMARVNAALSEMGRDTMSGMALLQEVLKHPDTPLDVKIQCGGLLLKVELPQADEQKYVAIMPWPVKDLAEWKRMFMSAKPDASPDDVAWHEKIAKTAIEDDKDRRSRRDNAPWLDATGKKDECDGK